MTKAFEYLYNLCLQSTNNKNHDAQIKIRISNREEEPALPINRIKYALVGISSKGMGLVRQFYKGFKKREVRCNQDLADPFIYVTFDCLDDFYQDNFDQISGKKFVILLESHQILADNNKYSPLIGYAIVYNENLDEEIIKEIKKKLKYLLIKFSKKYDRSILNNLKKFRSFKKVIKQMFPEQKSYFFIRAAFLYLLKTQRLRNSFKRQ